MSVVPSPSISPTSTSTASVATAATERSENGVEQMQLRVESINDLQTGQKLNEEQQQEHSRKGNESIGPNDSFSAYSTYRSFSPQLDSLSTARQHPSLSTRQLQEKQLPRKEGNTKD